ncbi:SGNH hydrolase domain-containing protein [Sphaerisporangium rubeum]|uniref:Peptidoglycan/LPS O-acetylase OafA/YrhL n=1 Tax=Sphaerisporangium rubeum TaxID=321317 RepID=A0A7X0IGS5_9ACTN|nr:peptidoglycan/LPS O-acetylase OafA/YrhL [Sphaerisporangium rubeum]
MKRADIEGLRAVAVGMVVLGHCGVPVLAGGYVGVDVFFVVSGFLITSLLSRELDETGRISIGGFYARRALRLLPAATLVLVATLLACRVWLSPVRFPEYAWDGVSSAFYAVNFRLAVIGTDYLAQAGPASPFQHFWSLAVEEQFYLLWPLLIWIVWRPGRSRAYLVGLLFVLCGASFAVSVAETARSASFAYFGSHTRAWELGCGALLALVPLRRIPGRVAGPMSWAGLASVVPAGLLFDTTTPFPGYLALLPVAGSMMVIAGGAVADRRGAGLVLGRAPLVRVGGVSYSWYLWHWPFVVIGPRALGLSPSVPLHLALSVVSLGVAAVTLLAVENPLRFHRGLRGRPGRGAGLGAALSGGTAVLCLLAIGVPQQVAAGRPAPDLGARLSVSTDPAADLRAALAEPPSELPANLKPALTEVRSTASPVYRDGCHLGYESDWSPPCVYGDLRSRTTVVLFGDSHAAQWFPALEKLALERRWRLVSLTKAWCKVAAVTTIRSGRPYASCDRWRKKALTRIAGLRPAMVVMSSSDDGTLAAKPRDPHKAWVTGFRETFRAVAAAGAKPVVVMDTPWPMGDAPECVAAHPSRLARCANHLPGAIEDQSRRDALTEAAADTGATPIDPTHWLCSMAGLCPPVVRDTLVYRDDSHMTEQYAESLAPVLAPLLPSLRVP